MTVQNKTGTKKADASTSATKNKQQNKAYPKAAPLSNLKLHIGQLLLNLQTQSDAQGQWQVFESKLRRYLDLKVCEVNL